MRGATQGLLAAMVWLLSAVASAQAPAVGGEARVDATLPPTSVRVSGVVLEVGCVVTGAVRAGDRLVVSCAEARIRAFASGAGGAWALVEERRAPGEVSALFVAEGRAWALVGGAAHAVDDLPTVALAAPPVAPVPPPSGEGTASTESGTATATTATTARTPDAGDASGTAAARSSSSGASRRASGSRASGEETPREPFTSAPIEGASVLRFRGTHAVLAPGLPLSRGDRVELVPAEGTRHAVVVGTVSSVTEDAIEVDIGFGEAARVGDGVRTTRRELTGSLLDPPEVRRTISIRGTLGVLFDAAGIGTVDDLVLEWRSDLPFTLRVRAFPFAGLFVGFTTDRPEHGGALVGGGSVDALLDTTYFAIGVGLGFGQYTTRLSRTPLDPSPEQRVGFAVLPVMRIGPADGLHVEATGNILAVVDEFRFGGLDGRVLVPVMPGFWIVGHGGGWPSGLALGELGLRIAAEGNGGPGTIFVTPMVGFAGIDTGNHGFRSGPLVGIGVEGRIGQ